ncbi:MULTISPECIES: gliding motility-associated C-terminal domain-containing protein [unclassified Myroides]|uniref:gliding motility-associated C-terminal domain-containing protein n=1 Tax=unclassified Myroides TaxID=2642485 RepID=UPI0015FCEDAF|nr:MULTISPECIES: gliding motility-associated C-terminal domain-containing protein [unclassified Myroides]MBB1150789.1 gliding motility-associated C-terminal domain-containing protein [Myroides sp. NP-2]MDM1407621.1 gliding motility-associated C-terminal domain-containing protein [Myroides sp. DF42-4-2]
MKNNIQFITLLFASFFSFLSFSPLSYGQENLVLNPSFEDVILDSLSCTLYSSSERFNAAIKHWRNPTNSTSDIHHMSLNHNCSMYPLESFNPAQFLPRTGDAMVGLVLYTEEMPDRDPPLEYKEYVQGELKEPMIQGATYLVQFYAAVGNRCKYFSNNIGIAFLEQPYYQATQSKVNLSPDFNFNEVLRVNEEEKWTLLEFEYTAPTSGIKYFILGNFFGTKDTTYETRDISTLHTDAYYVFDDFSIINLTPSFDPLGPYCSNTDFTLPDTSKEGYTGTWSPQVNNQQTTTYTFTPQDPRFKPTTMTVEIIPPTVELQFDMETSVCKGSDFSLPSMSTDGVEGTWTPAINTQETTTYTFHPTIENPCLKPYSVEIKVLPLVDIALDYYCKDNQLVIEAFSFSEDQQLTYTWYINDQLIDDSAATLGLSSYANLLHPKTTHIEVVALDENGCYSTASIEFEDIQDFCFIPKGISPNGDGKNDFFDIHTFGEVDIQIYNRHGRKVYENNHYTNQWAGQSNSGTILPSATYFYQFITSHGEHYSGWVELTH